MNKIFVYLIDVKHFILPLDKFTFFKKDTLTK